MNLPAAPSGALKNSRTYECAVKSGEATLLNKVASLCSQCCFAVDGYCTYRVNGDVKKSTALHEEMLA